MRRRVAPAGHRAFTWPPPVREIPDERPRPRLPPDVGVNTGLALTGAGIFVGGLLSLFAGSLPCSGGDAFCGLGWKLLGGLALFLGATLVLLSLAVRTTALAQRHLAPKS